MVEMEEREVKMQLIANEFSYLIRQDIRFVREKI